MKEKERHWFVISLSSKFNNSFFFIKIKDLQKQLNAEKKKNERMQEKLTELLSGDKAGLFFVYLNLITYGSFSHST